MPENSSRTRWPALAVVCAGMLMVILDGSITTVALPAIQTDLHVGPAGLAWVVDAYVVAFGGLLLLAGRLGDLLGRRRVYLAGIAAFTAASVLCGLATGPATLIAARFLQGVGGATASAVGLGMVVALFPDPAERAKAFGVVGFTGAAGASLGQVLGGVLTAGLGWHWIFFINLPIGAAAVLAGRRLLADDRGPGLGAGADAPGAALVTGGLMLGVYTIVEGGPAGWTSARTLATGAASLVLLAAFLHRQARAATPLLPLRILARRTTALANLVQILMLAALFGFQILLALYLQQVQHYGALATGLAMLPAALTIGAVSLLLAARTIARIGERRTLLLGLALLTVGIALLTRLPAGHLDYAADVLPTLLSAAGFGLAATALTALGMADARPEDAGLLSGLLNTTQQVGAALGVAVLTALAAGRGTGGFHLAFGTGAALLLAAFLLALALPRHRPAAPAGEPVAEPPALVHG
ncbi:MFS transporter [Kitasatospora cineracea]|uniref:EmrB/QacA subfamily drug resistance transporter n=1 Tax=Kitasatospora cineracea TaxID=88074 RepID=A0A8G1UDK7_9ACTN|nr:MFS transporter [Kitasatospora cineracea]ROR42016.1 EmrB/QacA subfamily drug resistance transporter [Kitasatospora cineracea]